MTTREMFVLKTEADVNLGEYASLGTPDRLAMLQCEAALGRVAHAFGGAPRTLEVNGSPRRTISAASPTG